MNYNEVEKMLGAINATLKSQLKLEGKTVIDLSNLDIWNPNCVKLAFLFLCSNPQGNILSLQTIKSFIWSSPISDNSALLLIHTFRKKISIYGYDVINIRTRGYLIMNQQQSVNIIKEPSALSY